LHCLAHFFNLKYYGEEWLNVGPIYKFSPHIDREILEWRKIALSRIYHDKISLDEVEEGFIKFSTSTGRFRDYDVIKDKGINIPYAQWERHGATCIILQQLAMRLLS
jgi:hypothetical protein